MTTELILQAICLILGVWFIYIGIKTLLSKEYYITRIEETNDESVEKAYKSLPHWHRIYTRFGLGGKWLVMGLVLLTLFVYSLLK